MKKILLLTFVFTLSFAVNAQISTPAPSPFSKLEQKVGLTDIAIEYSRPGVKGRKIFGGLEPYGKVWRAGANSRTKITCSDDIMIDGQTLKAGTYAIFVTPNETSWDVFFYTDYNGGGAPQEWDDSKVAVKSTIQTISIPFNVETLLIDINNITNTGATLDFVWETTYVSIPFSVSTDEVVMASIEKTLNGPGFGDYYTAASYYYAEGKDINKAKEFIDKAMSMTETPRFWQLRQQSLIYAKSGDKKGAIALAEKSLAASEEAGNDAYVKMNKESLAEWMK